MDQLLGGILPWGEANRQRLEEHRTVIAVVEAVPDP
jgi:hypothetical protein